MCSWCWGFSPVIDAIRERFGPTLPIHLILGGLRPGTTEPMTDVSKRHTREHWEHVHEASGQPFDWRFFDRETFVYDTEPVSRAVVVMRRDGTEQGFDFLRRAHAAFYAENRDITDEKILADLAAEAGRDPEDFLRAFHSDESRQETWQDFAIAQRSGIRGFPCLLAGEREERGYRVVTSGYQPAASVLPALERWLATLGQPGAMPASSEAG
jgi:putative protein-disulfide isomerase